VWRALAHREALGHGAAVVVIAAATLVLRSFGTHINHTTVALSFLLIILFVATAWGPRPAVLGSLVGAICFNYFFLPPVGTFNIADPENWIALIAFLVTGITAGQLSFRAKQRADEANKTRKEIEHLYIELQRSFDEASQAKALKQSERLKSALLDAVTHDLRTPLTSIKASVTTLLDDEQSQALAKMPAKLTQTAREDMLQVIDEECDRLDKFIEDLMAMARIEAGEMQLRPEWGSVEEIVAAALKRAEPLTRNHQIEISLSADLPAVRVDERSLTEVLFVLLENAAKYSPIGKTIRVLAQSNADGMVRLAVSDQGPGIPVELRERVFDKFFRAMRNGDLVGHAPGTGMGLAIAKGIVEAHGGRIWIADPDDLSGNMIVIVLPTGEVEKQMTS